MCQFVRKDIYTVASLGQVLEVVDVVEIVMTQKVISENLWTFEVIISH